MPIAWAYFSAILTIGSIIYLLRESLLNPGPGTAKHTAHSEDIYDHTDKGYERQLSPTEVAYLSREGDGGFALIVLLFDVLHREMKDKIVGGEITTYDENQRPYEVALRKIAGGSLKEWSKRKIEQASEMVAINSVQDRIKLVRRLPMLYRLIRRGVEETVKDLFRDPRNIKKFVSLSGLLRLAAEMGAAGYKSTLAEELKERLTDEGYLATEETRMKTAKVLIAVFGISQVILLALILLTLPSQIHALIIYFCALIAAIILEACARAREFLPLYSELAQALSQVKEANIRIIIIRRCLNFVTNLLNALSVIAFLMLFGSGSVLLFLTHTVPNFTVYLMLIAQMLVQRLALTYLVEAYKLTTGEMPTKAAHRKISRLKHKYKQEETLPALKAMLSQSDYSQDLSYLIALYGLESLLLI
ncbi:MAG: hypothetical protein JST01_05015 [Cyanobacteria bacterium SZAS TMP-1]|nr:hypothetical protein [Cyanobacteria bacterium SZAS TMP-1]